MPDPAVEIGVGIVGAGSAGRQHVEAIAGSHSCSLVGYFDPAPEARFEGAERFTSVSALLADDRVDLLAFCSPPGTRLAGVREAASAGKAVLLEKPPTASLAEFDLVVGETESRGVPAGVMLQHRFAIPRLAGAESERCAVGIVEVSRPRSPERYQDGTWRSNPEVALGGITAHLGVHYLDLACRLLGEVNTVDLTAVESVGAGMDIRVIGRAGFTSGASLCFVVTGTSSHRSERMTCLGDTWAVTLTDGAFVGSGLAVGSEARRPTAALRTLVYDDMSAAIREGRQPKVARLATARSVMAILDRVREASAAHG